MPFPRYDVQVIVQHDKLQHALVRFVGIVGEAVAQVAVAAFCIRMAGFLLHLLTGHDELGIAQFRHALLVRVAGYASIARLIAAIIMKEGKQQDKLDDQDDHPASIAEEVPEFADGHRSEVSCCLHIS